MKSIGNQFALVLFVALSLAVSSANAGLIAVLNDDSQVVIGPKTSTLSFDAGSIADKLIVQVSGETSSGTAVVTYNGEPLTYAPGSGQGRSKGIYYLDNPYTGGAANLTVDMSAIDTVNGIAFGAVSIAGSDAGVTASNANAASSVAIITTAADSFVVAGHGSNGSGGVSPDTPLSQIYGVDNIGSARGAAGYESGVDAGSQSYSFSGVGANPVTSAAAFAPADDGRVAIADLFNTGVDASGNVLGNDVDDPHYQITDLDGTGPLPDSTIPSPPGAWLSNDADSRWIGVDNNQTNGNADQGDYTYETTFTIDADADLTTALISGRWATDNGGLDILLNGESIGGGISTGFGSLTNFVIDGSILDFVHGTNTLEFQFTNAPSSQNPTGLLVDDIAGWYQIQQVVPEPSTFALAALGLMGLAVCGFRRRK